MPQTGTRLGEKDKLMVWRHIKVKDLKIGRPSIMFLQPEKNHWANVWYGLLKVHHIKTKFLLYSQLYRKGRERFKTINPPKQQSKEGPQILVS